MDLLENIDQFVQSGERIFEISSKTESYFYNKLYSNFFHHFSDLFEFINDNNDCDDDYFQNKDNFSDYEIKYCKLILPIIKATLNQKMIGDNCTFSSFQFFLGKNKSLIYQPKNSSKNNDTMLILKYVENSLIFHNKLKCLINNLTIFLDNFFVKEILNLNSFIFSESQKNKYSFTLYSSISFNINETFMDCEYESIENKFISGVILNFNEDIIENIIKSILKNVTDNIFVIMFSMNLNNNQLQLEKLLTPDMYTIIHKYAYLNNDTKENEAKILNESFEKNKNILNQNLLLRDKFSFNIYSNNSDNKIEQKNSFILLKSHYPKNLTDIDINTIINFLKILNEFENNKNVSNQNLLLRDKLSFNIYTNNSDNKIEQKNSFTSLKSYYQKNLKEITSTPDLNINLSNLLITKNYIISKLGELNYNMNIISTQCFYFILLAFIGNFLIWLVILLFIFITVLKISHSISDPIDKLIKSVSMSNDGNNLNKENKELKNYLSSISYKDDSTINDLFILCKEIIIGKFKKEDNKKQKMRKVINSYNNISLVKTNNMIIDENEIMENMKNKEINFFEKQNLNKSITNNFIKGNNFLSQKKKINFDHCELSKPIFNNKFYNWNEYQLTKDNEYYQILKNELGEKNKKNVFGFFSKIIEKDIKGK